MYTLLFMLMLMQMDAPRLMQIMEPPPRLQSSHLFEVKAEAYPQEEVAFGDIVFLRYTYKNVSGDSIPLNYASWILYDFALYQDIDGHESLVWLYAKNGIFFNHHLDSPAALSIYSVLLQPDETFTMYEAVLMPSPALDNLPDIFDHMRRLRRNHPHPFWDFPENSRKEYSIAPYIGIPQHFSTRFHYSPARIPMVIVPRPDQEMQFLKGWFGRHRVETRSGDHSPDTIFNTSVYAAVDPILTKMFRDVTLEGKQELLDNLSSGTFRDLIQLHASLGLGSMEWGRYHADQPIPMLLNFDFGLRPVAEGEPERLFIDSYQSPDEKFWAWFDNLPEIQRHFLAIAVVRAYCARILAPNPEWVTLQEHPFAAYLRQQEEMERVLRRSAAEYANRREQYDRVIADWLPRLPQEPGEGREIIRLLERLQKTEEPSP